MAILDDVAAAAAASGMVVRGGFVPAPADGVPGRRDGRPVAAVVLLGNVGGSLWPTFAASPEYADGTADPLDRWTRRVVDQLAAAAGAEAAYPFGGPPHLPFQRWAMRAEDVTPSPLGLLIHPEYGLWHAYRAALLFADPIVLPPRMNQPNPCSTCADRPCLSACPVSAFNGEGYDVAACAGHLRSTAGDECMSRSCLARRACPIGRAHVYPPGLAAFHMRQFLRARD